MKNKLKLLSILIRKSQYSSLSILVGLAALFNFNNGATFWYLLTGSALLSAAQEVVDALKKDKFRFWYTNDYTNKK